MTAREDVQGEIEALSEPGNAHWDEKKDELTELPERPTPNQLRESLLMSRAGIADALRSMLELLDANTEAIQKLQGHRHSLEKNYSAQPEF